jgi:hypothetical protein
LVILWWDATQGSASDLHTALAESYVPGLLEGSDIEIASSWSTTVPDEPPRDVPMDLGSSSGSTNRLVQLLFIGGDTESAVGRVRAYTDAVEAAGLAELLLGAPFFATVVGTDAYVDQL